MERDETFDEQQDRFLHEALVEAHADDDILRPKLKVVQNNDEVF